MLEYWPGSSIVKSLNNGFTLGYRGTPHGYTPGPAPEAAVARLPVSPRRTGGFARNNGTIPGLGVRPNSMTVKRRA